MSPRVSVLVPAYKRVDTIVASVRSALDQTFTDLEVVVVDDHSQDGTAEALASIDDPRLTVVTHEQNRGGNAARQSAIDASTGEYIAFLDADDLWMPTKIDKQVTALDAAGPQAGLCYAWYDLRYPDGRLEPGRRPTDEGLRLLELYQGNLIGTFSVVMIRREILHVVGGPDPGLPACQDWEFYLRVNDRYSIVCVPEVLVHYWRDDSDEFRISSSFDRVVTGHQEVYTRIVDRIGTMPPAAAGTSRHYFLDMFANHASVRGVARVAVDTPVRDLTLAEVAHITRMVARASRKSAAALRSR